MTPPRHPDPLRALAEAYFGQGMDTLVRLLRLIPHNHRTRVLMGWRIALDALGTLSEDELGDPAAHDARLTAELREQFAVVLAVRAARNSGPSQSRPSES